MRTWNKNNLKDKVGKAVDAGKFQQKTAAIEKLVYGAALIFLNKDTSNLPGQSFVGLHRLPVNPVNKGRPDERVLRTIVFASLFRAWMLGKNSYPTINNKNYPPSQFVVFAEPILWGLGIGKTEDHLEEFRSVRKKVLEDGGFKVIRGKVY